MEHRKNTQPFVSIDQINERVNSGITVIKFTETKISKAGNKCKQCLFRCICGKEKITSVSNIVSGHTRSCGCIRIGKKRPIKYSIYIPALGQCWRAMIRRCYDINDSHYKDYGGRGVIVCEQWHNYQNFLDWALLNGWEKGLQIDKDIKGDGLLYSPETCCFVTKKVNANFKRNTKIVEYRGVKIGLRILCESKGIDAKGVAKVSYRLKAGWDLEKALTAPNVTPNIAFTRKKVRGKAIKV